MSADRAGTHLLIAAMLGVAAITWWFQLRPALEIDASRLGELSLQLGDWRGEPVPLESTVSIHIVRVRVAGSQVPSDRHAVGAVTSAQTRRNFPSAGS